VAAPLLLKDAVLDGASRFDVGDRDRTGGPPSGGEPERPASDDSARLGVWLLLGTISMLFIGFTSALLVRRASSDWKPIEAPLLLWINTAVLAGSSATLEAARRKMRGWNYPAVAPWLSATGALGLLFVVGQMGAWRMLAAQGVFLASNPHSSFFYMLTGVHVAHVLAALLWFTVVCVKVRRRAYTPGSDALGLIATFWHFLAGVWAYLLFVLFVL
jgi:cytochrome c oxidase subunit III